MGADGFGWWGVGGINPISQPNFGLNLKYAIFGGGNALKGQ